MGLRGRQVQFILVGNPDAEVVLPARGSVPLRRGPRLRPCRHVHPPCRPARSPLRRVHSPCQPVHPLVSPCIRLVGPCTVSCSASIRLISEGPVAFGARLLIIVGGDVHTRCRVVPVQPTVLPAQVQVQDRAAALQNILLQLHDGNRLVNPVHQTVPGQAGAVAPPRLVETPVFRNAQGRVVIPLLLHIHPPGGRRANLQDEVGRLALFRDDVGIVPVVGLRIHVEGDQQIGVPDPRHVGGRERGQVQVAPQQGGLGMTEVAGQVQRTAIDGQMLEVGHQFIGLAPGRIRERPQDRGRKFRDGGRRNGHIAPAGVDQVHEVPITRIRPRQGPCTSAWIICDPDVARQAQWTGALFQSHGFWS